VFNTLEQSWIPAREKNGDIREYGILRLLKESPNLVSVTDSSPPFEYGMYRLLIAFLTDVYRPESADEVEDLLENGSFEEERLDEYARRWKDRFDLFNAEHPFLQAKFDARWDSDDDTKSVANLISEIPSGNGHVHFLHQLESAHHICPEIAARALCASMLFTPAMVQGYPSGVNGSPPWFSMVQGRTLFETLLLNLWVPIGNLAAYDEHVIWKSDRVVEPKADVKNISYVEGLLFPNRRILLIPDEGGICTYSGRKSDCLIAGIHFKQGLNFTAYGLWIDPHTTRRTIGDDSGTVKPDPNKALWRDIGPVLLQENFNAMRDKKPVAWHRAPVISQLCDMGRMESKYPWISTCNYGLALDQAKQLIWMKVPLEAPRSLMDNSPQSLAKAPLVQKCIADAEEIGRSLRIAVRGLLDMGKGGIKLDQLAVRIQKHYWSELESIFFGEWMPLLRDKDPTQDEEWQIKLRRSWFLSLRILARTLFQQALDQTGRAGDVLLKSNHAQAYLELTLYVTNPDRPVEMEATVKTKKARR